MRIRIVTAVAIAAAAVPAFAQSPAEVTGPRTLTPRMVACTDLPVPALPQPKMFIKGSHSTDGRELVAEGGVVAIGRSPDDGLAPGQRFAVRRVNTGAGTFSVVDRETFHGVRTAGWITVTAVDENNALATVDFACDMIAPGDYLDVYTEPTLPDTASPMVYPDFTDRARILHGADHRATFGDGDVFSIDRGTAHGVVLGARFAIYRDWRDGEHGRILGVRPLVYVADAVVLELFEQTSKVVIVTTVDSVSTDDVAVPRRQP